MGLVAANLQPFDLGEFTVAPSVTVGLCRWSGLVALSPEQRDDEVIAANQTTARTEQVGEDNTLRHIEGAVRIGNGETPAGKLNRHLL
jgi:hypothetical protein